MQEESALPTAITESVADDMHHQQRKQYKTIDELLEKLNFLDEYWTVINQQKSVMVCHIKSMPRLKVTLCLEIHESCAVRLFVGEAEMQKLGDYKIPSHINDYH